MYYELRHAQGCLNWKGLDLTGFRKAMRLVLYYSFTFPAGSNVVIPIHYSNIPIKRDHLAPCILARLKLSLIFWQRIHQLYFSEMVELGKPQEAIQKGPIFVMALGKRITLKVNHRLVYKIPDSFQAVNIYLKFSFFTLRIASNRPCSFLKCSTSKVN